MDNSGAVAAGLFFIIMMVLGVIGLVCAVIIFAGMWKVFTKVGKPGCVALIPIYRLIVLLEITEQPTWWIILFFIPPVNLVIIFLIYLELAKKFGKDFFFALGLMFLPMICFPVLGFGAAQYRPTKYYY